MVSVRLDRAFRIRFDVAQSFLDRFKGQVIGIHPSLLPSIKHPNTVTKIHEAVVENGDTETGLTVFFADINFNKKNYRQESVRI